MEFIESLNGTINGIVWGPYMLLLLVGTGLFLSIRVGFIQFTKFGLIMKSTLGGLMGKEAHRKDDAGISPFQAVATALASTVGTGNITGVATAITIGGPGAVFWMWVSALVGMVTKYAEVLLAVTYREKNDKNEWCGGPMYYIENGLHWKWLAVIFAVFATFASFGIGNMTQANSIATALKSTMGIPALVSGVVVALVAAVVILGGVKRIAQVTDKLVPFMGVFYVVIGVAALIINAPKIPTAIALIFEHAFTMNSAAGGAAGYTMMLAMRYGVARGVFSNEAGLGSAPIAHAAANTDSPVKQGFWGSFEVFFDTILICSFTALVVLTSGLWDSGLQGNELTIAAFHEAIGGIGTFGVTLGTVLFALSTILGWSYYGEKSIEYLFRHTGVSDQVAFGYRVLFCFAIVLGATGSLTLVWDIADTLNGLMAIPNLIALLGLSGVIVKTTKEFFKKA